MSKAQIAAVVLWLGLGAVAHAQIQNGDFEKKEQKDWKTNGGATIAENKVPPADPAEGKRTAVMRGKDGVIAQTFNCQIGDPDPNAFCCITFRASFAKAVEGAQMSKAYVRLTTTNGNTAAAAIPTGTNTYTICVPSCEETKIEFVFDEIPNPPPSGLLRIDNVTNECTTVAVADPNLVPVDPEAVPDYNANKNLVLGCRFDLPSASLVFNCGLPGCEE